MVHSLGRGDPWSVVIAERDRSDDMQLRDSMARRTAVRSWALPFALVLVLLGATMLVSGSATGQVPQPRIVYTVSGTFEDGGTLTGSFIFDPNPACQANNCPRYSGVTLTTSGGGAVYQGTISYNDSDLNAASGGNLQLTMTPEQTFILTLGSEVSSEPREPFQSILKEARFSGTGSETHVCSRLEVSSESRKVSRRRPTSVTPATMAGSSSSD
jgi:hypothetical protein